MYKSHDELNVKGINATVGINNVIIFHYNEADIEFWKDKDNDYHVGIAYVKDGKETKYTHRPLGKEPKKWTDKVHTIKGIYEELVPNIEFTNYIKK